ncbi:DUF4224 domain-containing protein [Burkholderia gladioli]|uniref:DUF4224 domain-containing protein n=1 Tax=Burkholderia gladioli TaxID=28095 RepID=UPI0016403610|nr:DUF4224 domain-containing protein [Burkholderia gladioli]
MADLFLSLNDIVVLTGRKVKSKQVEALRRMGVPFFVNACGRPVVARSAIEGGATKALSPGWNPSIIGA